VGLCGGCWPVVTLGVGGDRKTTDIRGTPCSRCLLAQDPSSTPSWKLQHTCQAPPVLSGELYRGVSHVLTDWSLALFVILPSQWRVHCPGSLMSALETTKASLGCGQMWRPLLPPKSGGSLGSVVPTQWGPGEGLYSLQKPAAKYSHY
jgi:hypothetical protein